MWRRPGKKGRPIVGVQGLPHGSSDDSIHDILPSSPVQKLEGSLVPIRRLSLEAVIKFSFSGATLELTPDKVNHTGDSWHAVPSYMIGKR